MKKCGKCKEIQPDENFSWKIRNKRRQSYCKKCNRKANQEHYIKNKQKYKDKAKDYTSNYKKEIYSWIRDYCLNNPCVDCGETDFVVIDFDHISGVKNFGISDAISKGTSIEKIKLEVYSNCVPRCKNCHVRKTAKQLKWYAMID